ncbi:MAG: hypothetical protein FJZ38_25110 [Candidatus Rokubacteria bacterium]|nr:hypothetical protein [Candidatus Rokubacteria bacterium]
MERIVICLEGDSEQCVISGRYSLDEGEGARDIVMREFLDINDFDAQDYRQIAALEIGGEIIYGGGAFALSVLRREA